MEMFWTGARLEMFWVGSCLDRRVNWLASCQGGRVSWEAKFWMTGQDGRAGCWSKFWMTRQAGRDDCRSEFLMTRQAARVGCRPKFWIACLAGKVGGWTKFWVAPRHAGRLMNWWANFWKAGVVDWLRWPKNFSCRVEANMAITTCTAGLSKLHRRSQLVRENMSAGSIPVLRPVLTYSFDLRSSGIVSEITHSR